MVKNMKVWFAGVKYIHVFQAPACHKAVVTFEDFDLSDKQGSKTCDYDTLEIRLDVRDPEGKM